MTTIAHHPKGWAAKLWV